MKTNKITLNEVRNTIKNILKEEEQPNTFEYNGKQYPMKFDEIEFRG